MLTAQSHEKAFCVLPLKATPLLYHTNAKCCASAKNARNGTVTKNTHCNLHVSVQEFTHGKEKTTYSARACTKVRRRSCGAGVLSIQQPFGRDQLVFARARHTAPLAHALGKQGGGEMSTPLDWMIVLMCVAAVMLVITFIDPDT